jgi:dienelactone hydrolase
MAGSDAAVAAFVAEARATAARALAPDPALFVTTTHDWRDEVRMRDVPVRVYRPVHIDGKLPLVIFSHGIGGSREGYRYLGRHFAANGYLAVHIQHTGSDRQLWMGNPLSLLGRLSDAAAEGEALARAADVRFVLDRLPDPARDGAPDLPIDRERILIAGHSYGANTAMLIAGAQVDRAGVRATFGDARIRAAILISAPPFYGMRDTRAILRDVAVPTLHITATGDDIVIPGYRSGLGDRLEVFESMGAASMAPKLLAVFKGGAHSMFTDRLAPGGADLNPVVKNATRELALAFANRVLNLPGNGASALAGWRERHAPLLARYETVGAAFD